MQSDPTIVYGLVGGRGTLGRSITRAEVDKPTIYNTYTIDGLPPGPIANPGRAALEAVANPSRTQDLYFVADGTGGHVFAESLEQHNRNVQRWRQLEKEKEKTGPDVDKFAPPTPSVRGDQRGELDDGAAAFGALSMSGASASVTQQTGASLDIATAAAAIAKIAPKMPMAATMAVASPADGGGGKRVSSRKPQTAAATPVSAFTMGPGLEELGITVRGIGPDRAAAAMLDGPVAADDQGAGTQGDPTTFAVSAARRAELRAKAAKFGLDPGSDKLPADAVEDANTARPAQTTPPPAASQKVAHAKVIDASEGTPFDPLLDHTYDLNSPKTVPSTTALK